MALLYEMTSQVQDNNQEPDDTEVLYETHLPDNNQVMNDIGTQVSYDSGTKW